MHETLWLLSARLYEETRKQYVKKIIVILPNWLDFLDELRARLSENLFLSFKDVSCSVFCFCTTFSVTRLKVFKKVSLGVCH